MIWSVKVDKVLGLGSITYSGLVTYRQRRESKRRLAVEMEGTTLKCVLLDFSGAYAEEEDISELRSYLSEVAENVFLKGMKVALLKAPPEHMLATDSMARRIGYEVESFRTRAAALAWLELECGEE